MLSPLQQQALRAPRSIGLSSVAFQHGKQIPREFSGHGDDINPPLAWTGTPSSTQALAIVMDDPDASAPRSGAARLASSPSQAAGPDAPGGTFTHWTIWNLPSRMESIEAGAKVIPLGAIEGRNDAGGAGYVGPKPPSGTHRYVFRIFALDKSLDLPPNAPVVDVWTQLSKHTLAWGELVGTFTKP